MKKPIAIGVLIAGCLLAGPLAQRAQAQAPGPCSQFVAPMCADSQTISTSGNSVKILSNGGLSASFEEIVSGSPSTVSIVIQGCGYSGTCATLDTYATVANTVRSPTITVPYAYYTVTATWSGGTSPTVQVNTRESVAACHGCSGTGNTTGYALGSRALTFVGLNYQLGEENSGSAGSEANTGSRRCTTAENAISNIRLLTHGSTTSSGAEANWANPIILRYGIEYPPNTLTTQMTANGQTTVVQQPGSNILWDATGVNIPAGGYFCIRPYARVPIAPTSVSVASSTVVGSLTPSTTYYVEVGTLDTGLYSAASSVVNGATGSNGALAITLTPPANSVPSAYPVYLSTSSGGPYYLGCMLPATGQPSGTSPSSVTYVYTGIGCPTTTIAPPSAYTIYYSSTNSNGNSSTGSEVNVADTSGSTGQITAHEGPTATLEFANYVTLSNDTKSHPVIGLGDSKQAGTGIISSSSGLASGDYMTSTWFSLGLPTPAWTPVNESTPSAKAAAFFDLSQDANFRLSTLGVGAGSQVVTELGINDLTTYGWQGTAMSLIALCNAAAKAGATCYDSTMSPSTTSSNNFQTVAGQTVGANETARTSLNSWMYNGHQVTETASGSALIFNSTMTVYGPCTGSFQVGQYLSGGTSAGTKITALGTGTGCAGTYTVNNSQNVPISTITAMLPCNTVACGASVSSITGYFDMSAAAGEVSCSTGLPLQNGGCWPPPTYTPFTGLVLSGTPSNTAYSVASSTFTTGTLAGCSAVMTSGTQNGNSAIINIGTTTTALTLYANGVSSPTGIGTLKGFTGTAALAGDTFNITCPESYDGTHPSQTGYAIIGTGSAPASTSFTAASFGGWAAANLIP